MPTTPYWLAESLPGVPTGSGTGPADVVVVGGGVTGCSCALTLARGGQRVRLLEAHEVAAGASGRNGGFALRGGAASYDTARDTLGREAARALWELTERGLDRMQRLAGDAFRRVGSLRLAAGRAERDALRREHEALREDGFAADWVEALPAPLSGLYAGGLVHPVDGALDPARWVRRLAVYAAEAGVEIVQHRPVRPAELDGLDVAAVVVAVDGATSELLPELEPLVSPVRGQVLLTEPLSERRYDRPHYARGGYDYWQQLPGGRLLVGGRRDTSPATERTAVDATTAPIQAELEALAAQLVGRPPAVTHRWAGSWGETPDRLPLAGRVPGRPQLWVAGGYSGHGNVLGLVCGDLVARAILGDEAAELELFDPARLPAP